NAPHKARRFQRILSDIVLGSAPANCEAEDSGAKEQERGRLGSCKLTRYDAVSDSGALREVVRRLVELDRVRRAVRDVAARKSRGEGDRIPGDEADRINRAVRNEIRSERAAEGRNADRKLAAGTVGGQVESARREGDREEEVLRVVKELRESARR